MNNLYLFIIWHNALDKKDVIIADIKNTFKIRNIINTNWHEDNFMTNISRFYGASLPDANAKIEECGLGNFVAIIVEDDSEYEYRETSKGLKLVNVKTFDKKSEYRDMTGGGHKVHSTVNQKETNHDLTLLFGVNVEDFINKYDEGLNFDYNEDLLGTKGWKSPAEIVYAMNNCLDYAILRDFDDFPECLQNENSDVDLLCSSSIDAKTLFNGKLSAKGADKYDVIINGIKVLMDVKYIGDNYYFDVMEKNMLENRIMHEKGFYVLAKEDYFYSLLYHALIHKPELHQVHKNTLISLYPELINQETLENEACALMKKWLKDKDYPVTKPYNEATYFNLKNATLMSDQTFNDDYLHIQDDLNKLKVDYEILNRKYEAVINSTIWRASKPLRNLLDKLKGN